MKIFGLRCIYVLACLLAGSLPRACAAGMPEKHHVVVIALDGSGSMAHSDPAMRRVAAAQLMLAAASAKDEIGVLQFGDDARWLGADGVTTKDKYELRGLETVGHNQQHTDFANLLEKWVGFLNSRPDGYFDTHDVSLVIFTDGQPDADGQSPTENAAKAMSLAAQAARNSKIDTIALGPAARQTAFLQALAAATGGRSAYASTDAELSDAFLQITTSVLALPVFQRLDRPGKLHDFGEATDSRLILIGGAGLSADGAAPLFASSSLQVLDATGVAVNSTVRWNGEGVVFYCRHQPIALKIEPQLPASVLLSQKVSSEIVPSSGAHDLRDAYFLQDAELHILAQAKRGDKPLVLSFPFGRGAFHGALAFPEAEDYELTAQLRAPYGELEQRFGSVRVSATAADIPAQIDLPIFAWFPRGWLPIHRQIHFLPTEGSATVHFEPTEGSVSPSNLQVFPGRAADAALVPLDERKSGDIWMIPYTVTWNDGTSKDEQRAILRVAIRSMSAGEMLKRLWPWMLAAVTLLIGSFVLLRIYLPRPLRGRLQIIQAGSTVFSVSMPTDWKTRRVELHITPEVTSVRRGSDRIDLPGSESKLLFALTSERRSGRWTSILTPAGAQVQLGAKAVYGAVDLSNVSQRTFAMPVYNLTVSFK